MRILKIASVGTVNGATGNVSVYTAAGERIHVSKLQAEQAEKGNFMIVMDKTFTQRTKRDEEGEIIMNGDVPEVEACEPWTRSEATFIGSKEECIEFSKEDELLELEAAAYIENKKEEISAARKAVKPQAAATNVAPAGVVS